MSRRGSEGIPASRGSERDNEEPVSGVAREALEAPPGPVGAVLVNRLRNYINETGIDREFHILINKLLSRDELPYNPYPGLAVRLRPFMEKFYVHSETAEKVEYALSVPLRETRLLNLFTLQDGNSVWGLRNILRVVDSTMLNRYRWLSENITPTRNDLYQKDGYSNQVMVALVGAAIFHGSFYRQVHIAQYRLEFLITGKHADEAVSIFVNSIVLDVDNLMESKDHMLIGLNVPVLASTKEDEEIWQLEFWDPSTIQLYKGELMQKLSDAVIGNKYIFAECVFRLEANRSSFIQGQKQYTMSFIEVVDEIKEEGLSSFAEYPMASLHEGLFLNQSHAESYISIFSPQFDLVDYNNIQSGSARPALQAGSSQARRNSAMIEDDYLYIHRHVHQRLQQHKPRRAKIDGFRIGEDPGSGPYAWQITSPIKSNLQKRIVGFDPWAQLFDIVYHMILLVLMDRKKSDTPILMELYRLCHSTAGKLHMLGERNKAVRALIRGFLNDDGSQVRPFLQDYKNDIDEIMAMSLSERSTDLVCVGRAMSAQVAGWLAVDDETMRSNTYLNHIVLQLRDQHSTMVTTLMRLSEDVLNFAPLLKEQIEVLHKSFPEFVPRPSTGVRDPQAAGTRDMLPKSVFMKHGYEDEHIMKHEHSTIVVSECMKKEMPQAIAKENVLMKYVKDTHLDEIWEKFLEESSQKLHPPLNPYPSFISRCRAAAMKMDLCFEPESAVLDRLLTKTAKVVDADNYVYQLPSCEACGPATSVALLDPGAYIPVLQTVYDDLVNKAYIHRKGPYRIGICLGMTGLSVLYGKMSPYLNELTLHEHYYIQGPAGCDTDAAQLFAVMIQKHVWELVSAHRIPIMGVFVGNDCVRWSWEEIINKKLGFFTEVEEMVLRKEPVYLKTFAIMDGWRYVPVVKHFLLHFMSEDGLGCVTYFKEDPVDYYSTVFSSPERAAFHYQNGGPVRGGNPLNSSNARATLAYMDEKLLRLREKGEFMEIYRILLHRSLLCDNTDHIVEAWQMFHSIAGQACYVASLAQALAELVEYELEYVKFASVELSTAGSQATANKGSPVNLGIVSAMMSGLVEKSKQVAEWRISMCAASMGDFVSNKLKTLTEKDAATGKIYPKLEDTTVEILEEIQHMYLSVAMTAGNDVHNMCSNGLQTFRAIEKQASLRPSSVDSEYLNDPQLFQHRPRAEHRILDDDLLYRPRLQPMYKPEVSRTQSQR